MHLKFDSLSYTFRRRFLDQSLAKHKNDFAEPVIEIGSGSQDQRGRFRCQLARWYSIDILRNKKPTIIGNGENLPIKTNSAATLIALEILEHVENPDRFIKEMHRVLKPKSRLYLSMPFLYRYHAAPFDYQRYTESKLRKLFQESGFIIDSIECHGYYFSVLSEQIKSLLARIPVKLIRQAIGVMCMPFLWLLILLDQSNWVKRSDFLKSYTTGFFVTARRIE